MIEEFEGMLTDGIWLRLAIEEKVKEMQAEWKEVTAQNIAMELTDMDCVPGPISSAELLETCEDYLRRFSDPFAELGFVPDDLKILTESGKNALFKAVTAKSNLYKAHAVELDTYVKAMFEDDVIILTR